MAQVEIRLTVDPSTGKKNVVISYRSDQSALPMEHEEDHRRIVDKLIEGGALNAAELGQIVVEREGGESVGETDSEGPSGQRESVDQDQ